MKLIRSFSSLLYGLTKALLMLSILGTFRPMVVAAATEYNDKIPFTDDFDGCSGERITVSGIQHVVGHTTRDANGRFHYVFTRNTQGTGIGQSTGDKYILTDAVTQLNADVLQGQTQTLSQEYHTVLVHLGEGLPGDDTVIHFLSKIRIDANGIETSSIEIQSVECR